MLYRRSDSCPCGSSVAVAVGCTAGGPWLRVRSARPAAGVRVSSVLFLRSDLLFTERMDSGAWALVDGGLADSLLFVPLSGWSCACWAPC